jgi:hypothetical protein
VRIATCTEWIYWHYLLHFFHSWMILGFYELGFIFNWKWLSTFWTEVIRDPRWPRGRLLYVCCWVNHWEPIFIYIYTY